MNAEGEINNILVNFREDTNMEEMTTEAFGDLIRLKRENLGWSQKELSEKSNVDRSSISKLEAGELVGALVYDKVLTALDIEIPLTFPRKKK